MSLAVRCLLAIVSFRISLWPAFGGVWSLIGGDFGGWTFNWEEFLTGFGAGLGVSARLSSSLRKCNGCSSLNASSRVWILDILKIGKKVNGQSKAAVSRYVSLKSPKIFHQESDLCKETLNV